MREPSLRASSLRSPRLGALLLAALAACSSAQPAAQPAPSAPAAPGRPATFSFFFEFEPALAVGLKRDGAPFEGPAELDSVGKQLPGPAGEEEVRFRGSEVWSTSQDGLPVKLVFQAGRAAVPQESLDALSTAGPLLLRVAEREVLLPAGTTVNPFRCASTLNSLDKIDACTTILPPSELAPEDCDSRGQRAWRAARAAKQERFEACFADLSRPTIDRLLSSPELAPVTCPRMIELTGPEPGEDVGVALLPLCSPYFSPETRQKLERVRLKRDLPRAFEQARKGTTDAMHTFFLTYREMAPAQTEEIRKLAAERFGPKDRKAWLSLRDAIEAVRLSRRRFTLCDVQPPTAEVAVNFDTPPRVSEAPEPPVLNGIVPVRMVIRDYGRRTPDAREQRQISALLKLRARATDVRYTSYCSVGRHWYFSYGPVP